MAIASLITLTMIIFSYIKASDAEKAKHEAEMQAEIANQNMEQVMRLSELAEQRAAEAEAARTEAERLIEELLACQSK